MLIPAHRGLGATPEQYASVGVQAGGATATAIGVAMHAAWVPLVGPIVAGVAIALALIMARKGPQQRIVSTKIVEEIAPQLEANLHGYLTGPRTRTSQAQALKNFDDAWTFLTGPDACGNRELGNPGRACISDRQAGACVWRDASGQCWNWHIGYRDPIANDPHVKEDPTTAAGAGAGNIFSPLTGQGIASSITALPAPLLIGAGLILLGIIL